MLCNFQEKQGDDEILVSTGVAETIKVEKKSRNDMVGPRHRGAPGSLSKAKLKEEKPTAKTAEFLKCVEAVPSPSQPVEKTFNATGQ